MTFKQFHASLKRKWPDKVFDTADWVIYVDELCLTFIGEGHDDYTIRARMLGDERQGYGPNLNTAISDLSRTIKQVIRDNQEALRVLKKVTCTTKSKKPSSKETTSKPPRSAKKP